MKIKLLPILILLLFLQGCSSGPSLERAVDFEKGVSHIPEGDFIFLEYRSSSVCSDACRCPVVAPSEPLYELTSAGELWIIRELGFRSADEPWVETDPQGIPALSAPIVGFFVFNDWGGQIQVMETLPFTLSPSDANIATVYSVDADGTAVVEIFGETYYMKPGESWTDSGSVRQEPPAGCRVTYSSSITNFGLFSQSQLHFGYPDLNP